jgi:hypothetical protein
MDFFKSVFDITKLPTKIFLVLSLISGFFIFANEELIKKFKLEKFDEFGQYIGAIFLFSSSLVAINFNIWIFNTIATKIRIRKLKKEFSKRLKELDYYERAVLREFYINGKNSLKMPIDDAVVSGLLNKNILVYNQQLKGSMIGSGLDFVLSINPLAKKYLMLEDINMSYNETEENRNFLLSNRPNWVNRMDRYDRINDLW